MLNNIPIVKPKNIPEYEYKQSKYDMVPKLPFRSIIVASSTGGKTVLIQNFPRIVRLLPFPCSRFRGFEALRSGSMGCGCWGVGMA